MSPERTAVEGGGGGGEKTLNQHFQQLRYRQPYLSVKKAVVHRMETPLHYIAIKDELHFPSHRKDQTLFGLKPLHFCLDVQFKRQT